MFDRKIRNARQIYTSNLVNLLNDWPTGTCPNDTLYPLCKAQLEWKWRKMRGQGLCEDRGEDVGRERVVYNGLLYTLISSVSLETIAEHVSSGAVTSANMSPLEASGWQPSPLHATDVVTAAESSVGSTDPSGGPIRATFAFLSRHQSFYRTVRPLESRLDVLEVSL